ncbi:YbaB/EbfC family nucleoid-associated protein [Sedimentibacter sp. zth1]|uniref:YbaB/EbfC family nucleoid-associated protein n=1 Tax=Sedimentibacter sp. zth1 TaxID=2816908 RepID=UPI001A9378B2|nr:YbaB/EbfC family nucleoid-associated protein [Sedimentibacter sp. zth1]QSX05826.1 YbaB/EbfC family nucleoid-associated protein [Sedimentibacter sp. zth1]
MKGRKMPPMGGGNMNNMMKQVQKMQQQMEAAQREIEDKELESTSGGGAVTVVITGKKVLKSIKIDPEVVDKDDVEMLEDLVVAAINEAFRKADEVSEQEMKKVTGGINIPGLF